MKYRLVALDLDGTVVGPDLTIAPRVREAVARAQEAGLAVMLASGRMFQGMLPVAQELGVRLPVICYQGALIKDPLTKDVLVHRTVPLRLAQEAIGIMREMGFSLNAYLDEALYVEEVTPEAQTFALLSQTEMKLVADLATILDDDPTGLAVVGDEAATNLLAERLRRQFGERLRVMKSVSTLCEVVHPASSKGRALALVCSQLGIAREETVAIGDSANDLDMIHWAGLGIAMCNAAPEVIAAADWVTAPVNEDGAALALEMLLEGNLRPGWTP